MVNIERWKKRKKELGWTLDDIAEKSGISRRTVARVFSGNPKYPDPTYNTVQAIERALGLSEWTAEEKALGVGEHAVVLSPEEGEHAVVLSPEEMEWLELRSEIIRTHGKEYADTLTALIQKITENPIKK